MTTPQEEADEILAALTSGTPEPLAYAVLAAASRANDARAARRHDEARHWSAVHEILRRAAGGRPKLYRVQP